MCELCSSDEKEKKSARDGHIYRAAQLRRMADFEESIAHGFIKPHTAAMKKPEDLAHSIIRYLAEDWL